MIFMVIGRLCVALRQGFLQRYFQIRNHPLVGRRQMPMLSDAFQFTQKHLSARLISSDRNVIEYRAKEQPSVIMSSSLNSNLDYSTKACNYVLKTVKLEGANWDQYSNAADSWEDCIGRFGDRKVCAPYLDQVDVCVYDVVRPKVQVMVKGKDRLEYIRIMADIAKKNKCGNCGEFSALAFSYLYGMGVRPLDWMSLVGGDHAFVVVGRAAGDANDHKKWGTSAAVCDPWGQGFRSGDAKTGTYAPASSTSRWAGS